MTNSNQADIYPPKSIYVQSNLSESFDFYVDRFEDINVIVIRQDDQYIDVYAHDVDNLIVALRTAAGESDV